MNLSSWQLRLFGTLAFLAGSIATGTPALAGSFRVNPVNLLITPDRTSTSVSISNSENEPVSVHVLTQLWTQQDGKDTYSDTSNVIVSPPIFTLGPGQTQLVRVGLKSRRSGEAYRVIFEEIPRHTPKASVIQVTLRLDLPLFVEGKRGEANVRWQIWRDASGALTLAAQNTGNRHLKVRDVELVGKSGGDRVLTKEVGVVLPSGVRRWDLGKQPDINTGSAITLKIRTPAGEIQQEVAVQQR